MTASGSFYFPCSIQVSRIKFAGQKICFQSVDWNLAWEFCEILRSVCLRRIWSVSEILQISSRQALEVQCLEPRSSLLEFFFPHELVFFILDQQLFPLKATYHFHDHSQVSPKKKEKIGKNSRSLILLRIDIFYFPLKIETKPLRHFHFTWYFKTGEFYASVGWIRC